MEVLRPEYNNELNILSNNLNIPIDELTTYLEQEINKHLGIDSEKLLKTLIIKSADVDSRKGRNWLRSTLFQYLKNAQEIIKDNTFNIIKYYNKLRAEKFGGNDVDKYLIEEISLCILGQPHITVNQLETTLDAIIQYMCQSCQPHQKTYETFVDYLMKSKLVREKCHINLETLRAKVERELEEIKNVINN